MVAAAYDTWKCADRKEQTLAFSGYVAALNCEEEAATGYHGAVEHLVSMTGDRGGSAQV